MRNFTLDCKGVDTVVQGCEIWCIKRLSCMCIIKNANVHFIGKYHNVFCDSNETEISTYYPINMAMITRFFNHTYVSQMLQNISMKDPLKVILPELKFYDHEVSGILADDFKNDLSLRKISDRAKKRKFIYTNLADTILDGEVLIDPPFSKWHIITIVSITCSIVHTLIIMYLLYKIHMLFSAYALIGHSVAKEQGISFIFTQCLRPLPHLI